MWPCPRSAGSTRATGRRKPTLVEHGFRLPSALDNRPLTFDEFSDRVGQVIFLSATPGAYEINVSSQVAEQVIRPTGLVDPEVVIVPTTGQIDDLLERIRVTAARRRRILVTTLTKKMAEDLTDYLLELGVRVRYLHSDVDTITRIELLRDLRLGSSTSWSASTCCGRAWTCPRSSWWPSSTPTRRASCARPRR